MQMMKFIGKPYAGKPHVRFDEGAGKALAFPALLYREIKICEEQPAYRKAGTSRQNNSNSDKPYIPAFLLNHQLLCKIVSGHA
jgi:hypothetical protein